MSSTAQITADPAWDFSRLAALAGVDVRAMVYRRGVLAVSNLSQAVLERAVADYLLQHERVARERRRAGYEKAARQRIDRELKARGYDATWTPETYLDHVQWGAEAAALVRWKQRIGDALDALGEDDLSDAVDAAATWAVGLPGPDLSASGELPQD